MNFFETLTEKRGPLPTWVWALLGTGLLAVYLIHRKKAAGANPATAAQQAQTNAATNLNSAAELANMFQVAGLMPYQGGNVYVNETEASQPNGGPPPPKPPKQPGEKESAFQNWQIVELAMIKLDPHASGAAKSFYANAIKNNPELVADINAVIPQIQAAQKNGGVGISEYPKAPVSLENAQQMFNVSNKYTPPKTSG